jgi:hypothetical protein
VKLSVQMRCLPRSLWQGGGEGCAGSATVIQSDLDGRAPN